MKIKWLGFQGVPKIVGFRGRWKSARRVSLALDFEL